jgi:hypothetical protein
VRINPFALGSDRIEAAFLAKLASVARLAGAMAGGLAMDERPALDRAVWATYEVARIARDPRADAAAARGPSRQVGEEKGG